MPWHRSAASAGQPRYTAMEIQAAILGLLAGELFWVDRSWRQIWWGVMHLRLCSGLRIAIRIERDALGLVQSATAPDGRTWIYGCQR